NMEAILPMLAVVGFIFAIIVLIVGILLYQRRKERERTQQLQAVANQLGWNFVAAAPLNMIAGMENFALFDSGHRKEIKHMMYGEANGVKSAVFDYVYVTGYGKNRQTHHQ